MDINNVVRVVISRQTQGVTRAGFGIPLVLGATPAFAGIRTYSSLAAAATDLGTGSAEYAAIRALFAQTPRPARALVKKTRAAVAQVVTITPDVVTQAVTQYRVTVNGIEYTFTSDATPTAAEVVTGLSALVNADATNPVTASGTTTLVLTADSAGEPFTYAVGTKLAAVLTTASAGIADDILEAVQQSKDWYMVLLAGTDLVEQRVAAQTIEALRRMLLVRSNEAGIVTGSTTDRMSFLKGKNYNRTALLFTTVPNDQSEAAWAGRCLPLEPGSETWAFKGLSGVTTDPLTDTEVANAKAKNANYFVEIGGRSVTINGKVASGEYIDIIRGIDKLQARMEEEILVLLLNSDKVPFTDGGIALIEQKMRFVLDREIASGLLSSYTLTIPKASEISINAKAARTLEGLGFVAIAQGAVHELEIRGVVTL